MAFYRTNQIQKIENRYVVGWTEKLNKRIPKLTAKNRVIQITVLSLMSQRGPL